MRPCHLKDSLGKPGEGLHRHVFGVAIFDVLLTLGLAVGISYAMKMPTRENIARIFASLFLLAQILHWFFCVETSFQKLFSYNSCSKCK